MIQMPERFLPGSIQMPTEPVKNASTRFPSALKRGSKVAASYGNYLWDCLRADWGSGASATALRWASGQWAVKTLAFNVRPENPLAISASAFRAKFHLGHLRCIEL